MPKNCSIKMDEWKGMYGDSWASLIVPDAFSHPAKFAKNLIFAIVKHALEEGFIRSGDRVLDCFAGVSLSALPCLLHGINYVGVELESRFIELGRANLAHWQQRYGLTPGYGQGTLVQGDSRELCKVLATVGISCVVSSPPYQRPRKTSAFRPGI